MRLRPTAAIAAAALTSILLTAPGLAQAKGPPNPPPADAPDPISGILAGSKAALSANPLTGWQCAQFARLFSGIQIFGDAWTWWNQAAGKYARGSTPQQGSVLVFRPAGAMRLGHVSVVSQVLTDRIIQVTHANWSLIGGKRGQVEKDVTVVDVSPQGDWSQVKVWYDPTGDLGRTVYPTYGFIYKAASDAGQKVAAAFGAAAN